MLLFERCGEPQTYAALIKAVNEDTEGKPRFLAEWEEKLFADDDLKLKAPWDSDFVREWLTVPPRLADLDLRGVLYVSREHAPLITPEDRLSSAAAELLSALLEHPDMATALQTRLVQVPRPEMSIIMGRLLDRARQEQEWGVPPILEACLAVIEADPAQGSRLAAFLRDRPVAQITPSIVPKIGDQFWASEVFEGWRMAGVSAPVKRAIAQQGKKDGNVAV
jgi:predicted KAP-like P-loop ATPase